MQNLNNDYERYQKAKEKVKEIKDFYSHLIVYLCVISFLVFINLKYSPEHIWFYWPMLGWGIGVVFHGLSVHDVAILSKSWEDKKIREFMEEEKNKQNKYE